MAKIFDLENFPTSKNAKKMLSYVTENFYDTSYVGKWIYQVMGLEFDDIWELFEEDLAKQLFVETATWGLYLHEIKWSLPIRENLSVEERRKLIYEKRDYHAPMTPWKMEQFLYDVIGMEVHVADVHDASRFNFVPEHPNIFKVFFVGDETLDVKKAKFLINKLKQSHTAYTINDRREVVIDESDLERIILSNINFGIRWNFWDVRTFDGKWLFDGEYLMDARRRYGMRIDITRLVAVMNEKEEMRPASIKYRLGISEKEKPTLRFQYGFAVTVWPFFYFDGTWLFDGERHMNARIMRRSNEKLRLSAKVKETETFAKFTIGKYSKNYWVFNGEIPMDGSRHFDSVYREEEIV